MKQVLTFHINSCWKRLILLLFLAVSFPSYAINQEEAITLVQNKVGGKILDIRSEVENSRTVFWIKVITSDSRVVIVKVDAVTGDILK